MTLAPLAHSGNVAQTTWVGLVAGVAAADLQVEAVGEEVGDRRVVLRRRARRLDGEAGVHRAPLPSLSRPSSRLIGPRFAPKNALSAPTFAVKATSDQSLSTLVLSIGLVIAAAVSGR